MTGCHPAACRTANGRFLTPGSVNCDWPGGTQLSGEEEGVAVRSQSRTEEVLLLDRDGERSARPWTTVSPL